MLIKLSKAIEGFTLQAQARRLSPNTLLDYGYTFRHLTQFLAGRDPKIRDIDRPALVRFLSSLSDRGLSKKTVLNAHIALSALWQWATVEGFTPRNIVRDIKPPKPTVKAIEPFTQADVKALLRAVDSVEYFSRKGTPVKARAHMAGRNKAIILMLLDCCMRVSELTALRVRDCDLRNRRIKLIGKGDKERYVSFAAETGRMLWRYLATREAQPADPLFSTGGGRALSRSELRRTLARLGTRAGVSNVYPHRFRHTGAIEHLRNGMPAPVVQEMLGHSSMSTTRRYLNLAGLDMAAIHQHSSPVTNWAL